MPILGWIIAKFTGEAVKTGGDIAKTAVEIPKTIVETQKARLEVNELLRKEEERARLIVTATFADIEKYDPRLKQIEANIRPAERTAELAPAQRTRIVKIGNIVSNLIVGFGMIVWFFVWGTSRNPPTSANMLPTSEASPFRIVMLASLALYICFLMTLGLAVRVIARWYSRKKERL